MHISKIFAALCAMALLAGCLDTDTERAAVGAAGGAVVSTAVGGSVAAGAVVGAAAGALCDDAGLCN